MRFTHALATASLLTLTLALLPIASAVKLEVPSGGSTDCNPVAPANGFGNVYLCPGNRWEVRSGQLGGMVLATGPANGVGWYVTNGDGSLYTAVGYECVSGWCYLSVITPLKSCQVRYQESTFQFVTCPL